MSIQKEVSSTTSSTEIHILEEGWSNTLGNHLSEAGLNVSNGSAEREILMHVLNINDETAENSGVDLLNNDELVALSDDLVERGRDLGELVSGQGFGRGNGSNALLVGGGHLLVVHLHNVTESTPLLIGVDLEEESGGGLVGTEVLKEGSHKLLTTLQSGKRVVKHGLERRNASLELLELLERLVWGVEVNVGLLGGSKEIISSLGVVRLFLQMRIGILKQ